MQLGRAARENHDIAILRRRAHRQNCDEREAFPARSQTGECVICLTECVVRVTACGHQFCSPCLTRYAEVSRASSLPCPMCRRPLTSDDLPPEARSAIATNINVPQTPDFVVLDDEQLLEVVRRARNTRPMEDLEYARLAELRQLQRQVRDEEVDVVDGVPRDIWEAASEASDVGVVQITTAARLAWAARRRFAEVATESFRRDSHEARETSQESLLMLQLRQSEMRGTQLALLDALQHPLRYAVLRRSVREPTTWLAMQREQTAQRQAELDRYEALVEERRRAEEEADRAREQRRAEEEAADNARREAARIRVRWALNTTRAQMRWERLRWNIRERAAVNRDHLRRNIQEQATTNHNARNARAGTNLHVEVRRAAEMRARTRTRWDDVRRRFGFGRRAASVDVPTTTTPQATAPRALRTDAERDARDAHAAVGI